MQAALAIGALWALFVATHSGLSSTRLRPRLVVALGQRGYLGLYSLVAFAIFLPLVVVYATNKHAGPFLWYLGPGVRPLMYAGMAVAASLIAGGLITPSPASLTGGSTGRRGVLRLTRHPLFMGVGLFGALHLFAMRVNAAELACFGGGVVAVLLGCWHQDRRKLQTDGEDFAAFYADTHFLPRPGRDAGRAIREAALPITIGVALTFALRWAHPWLFG